MKLKDPKLMITRQRTMEKSDGKDFSLKTRKSVTSSTMVGRVSSSGYFQREKKLSLTEEDIERSRENQDSKILKDTKTRIEKLVFTDFL